MKSKILKRLFTYLKGSSGLAVLSIVIGILFGSATVAIPYFAGRAIDSLADIDQLKIPFADFVDALAALGKTMGLDIHAMHEDIFNTMHHI